MYTQYTGNLKTYVAAVAESEFGNCQLNRN